MERLPGFRDFYPEPLPPSEPWSAEVRQQVFTHWRHTAERYGFKEYDGPPLETLELFTTKSGEEIVGQLYNFIDKGERAVALRPEMTPTLARMVAARERNYKKPIKWFALPHLFRYERQQKGRLREHFQFNADIVGESDVAADAELIALLIDTLRAFGLTQEDFVIRLSSRNAWHEFFTGQGGNPEREYDFYQAVDKLERETQEQSEARLKDTGIGYAAIKSFIDRAEPTTELATILANLAARGLTDFIRVDYHVIRGLAYYTGPVFEAFDRKGEFRAIAGGGRYDNLLKLVSGGKVDLPALGFGMGDVVLVELLKARGLLPRAQNAIDVFWLIEDEAWRNESLRLVQVLRNAGHKVDYSFTPAKADKQFKRAQETGAVRTASLERNEGGLTVVRLKNLRTREEKIVEPQNLVEALR